MAISSGSKLVAAAITLLFFMLLQFEAIHSTPTTYIVGDEDGWDLVVDMQSWTQGKNFHAGDLLEVRCCGGKSTGHDSCTVNRGAKVFTSGNDKISLVFGANYFIDSVADVCAAGMKMAINATAPTPSS